MLEWRSTTEDSRNNGQWFEIFWRDIHIIHRKIINTIWNNNLPEKNQVKKKELIGFQCDAPWLVLCCWAAPSMIFGLSPGLSTCCFLDPLPVKVIFLEQNVMTRVVQGCIVYIWGHHCLILSLKSSPCELVPTPRVFRENVLSWIYNTKTHMVCVLSTRLCKLSVCVSIRSSFITVILFV